VCGEHGELHTSEFSNSEGAGLAVRWGGGRSVERGDEWFESVCACVLGACALGVRLRLSAMVAHQRRQHRKC